MQPFYKKGPALSMQAPLFFTFFTFSCFLFSVFTFSCFLFTISYFQLFSFRCFYFQLFSFRCFFNIALRDRILRLAAFFSCFILLLFLYADFTFPHINLLYNHILLLFLQVSKKAFFLQETGLLTVFLSRFF